MNSRTKGIAAIIFLGLLTAGFSHAQQFTKAEIGINGSLLYPNRLFGLTDTGAGSRFTYNLSPSLAIDSEFDSYFTNLDEHLTLDGGRATVFVAGVKAGLRRDRYGVFFKARPGIMSFGDVLTSAAILGDFRTVRKTHAALDLGVVTEFYPTAHIILRVDVGQLLTRVGDSTVANFGNAASVINLGRIGGPLHVEIGAGYRLGDIIHQHETSSSPRRFEAGAQYSLFSSNRGFDEIVRDESGVGGWFTWNFSKYVSFDSAATFFPRKIHLADIQQGGKIFQALAGLRAGIRRGNIGVFGKFRPGMQRYTLTLNNAETFQDMPFTDVAFDTGGILEIYGGRRTTIRFDAGNTAIYFRPRTVTDAQGNRLSVPGFVNNTIQLTAGIGFRF